MSLRKVFVKIKILFRIRIRIRIMILLWISIYISYIEDTHQILFGSANSFKSYCVHMKSPRTYVHPDIQTNRQTEIFVGFFCLLRHTNHENSLKGEIFFHSCAYNTLSFYILRMWWESKYIFMFRTLFYVFTIQLCLKNDFVDFFGIRSHVQYKYIIKNVDLFML